MTSFFNNFQILSLFIFLILFIGRSLLLKLRSDINVFKLGAGNKRLIQQVVEILIFVGLLAWVIEVYFYANTVGLRLFPAALERVILDHPLPKIVGVGLISAGLVLFVGALVSFKDSWRIGVDHNTPGQLVTGGIFSLSRNPIFLFVDMYFVGTFLMNGSLIFLIFAVITVLGLHYQILQEEAFLPGIYGQSYLDYCRRTPRYFGLPKNR
ncbi:MAG: isoprenylcysteine carboxylmethyltransferase family protein [Anaerolineae bacterium]|nr:isoprenylcysteine carboxylmethyltransferase family protein [Anaerolineae bacterium]